MPVVNFFEYYYLPHDAESDMDFRSDLAWAVDDSKYLRSRCRNAMILLDLQNCQVGYTPTGFQKSRFPSEYQGLIRTIFDGVDREAYHGYDETLRSDVARSKTRTIAGVHVPAGTGVVTYVSRGFESMRGFDIFMKAAKRIVQQRPDTLFIVVGTDRVAYGGDTGYTDGKSFKEWVLAQDDYPLDRMKFVGRLPPPELGRVLASSDLHIYLTVPFVLSWSMMDALSCGAVVLASDTAPVREMIEHGKNGLLADFFDPEAFARQACDVLADPAAHRPLGREAERRITERYSLEAVIPQMLQMYDDALHTPRGLERPRNANKTAEVTPPGTSPFAG